MSDEFVPCAFLLHGVTENRDEDGNWFEKREMVLSWDKDDAGDIDMRISDAEPLFDVDALLYFAEECEDLEEFKEKLEEVEQ